MNRLKIIFSIIEKKEKTDEASKSRFLRIVVENYDPVYVNYDEFKVKLAPLKTTPNVESFPSEGGLSVDFSQKSKYEDMSDYIEILNFLLSSAKIEESALTSVDDLIIESDLNQILELPWEKVFTLAVVFRKYPGTKVDKPVLADLFSNFAFLLSHSYKGIAKDVSAQMNEEVLKILEILVNNRNQLFGTNNIFISRHTTKKIFSEVNWKQYTALHVISHGNLDGDIVLENDDPLNYKFPDIIEKDSFVRTLKECDFKLIFLSLCNSAGGLRVNQSIAYKLIKEGIANYCIAYHSQVGEDSALSFARHFYERILVEDTIEDTYRKSLNDYKKYKSDVKYLPYIFLNK